MQTRSPRLNQSTHAPRPLLRVATFVALGVIVGSALVVLVDHEDLDLSVLTGTTAGPPRADPRSPVGRLAAEGDALRAEIEQVSAQLAAIDHSTTLSRSEALVVRARHAAQSTRDLLWKMEAAANRGEDFVVRHLHGEVRREYKAARTYLDEAKQGLARR